jgi:hypothetical protein
MKRRRGRALKRRYGRSGRAADGFAPCASWADVLANAKSGVDLYYWAPLDHRPVRLRYSTPGGGTPIVVPAYEPHARTIRIWPYGSVGRGRMRTADPFTADAKHLDRFFHKTGA